MFRIKARVILHCRSKGETLRTRIAIAFTAAAAAGCSSQPQQPVDNTPENPTAVFETLVSSSGIAGMFPFETTERHYVRAAMRRDEHATKGTGTFTGFLVTRVMGQGDSSIARLDRKLRWTLFHGRKEYTECPVHGCPHPAAAEKADKPRPAERREEPKQKAEEGCVMRIASSKFDVTPTSQKRALNGFNTEQYQAAWVVRMQDGQKRTTTSTVKFDVWTAPVNAQMRQAFDTEAAFGRAFIASAPRAAPAGNPSAERKVMPPEMMTMMTGYLGNLSASDRAAFSRAVRELDKIKGYPISTKIDWLLDGNACGSKDEPAAQPGPAGMLSGLGGMLGSKKDDGAPKPLVSFTVEVKQLGMQPVRDGFFSVPASYKLVKQPDAP
jgi:hypothetical protein